MGMLIVAGMPVATVIDIPDGAISRLPGCDANDFSSMKLD